MARDPSTQVSLHRTEKPRRRFPWGIVIGVLLLLILAALGYLFQRPIMRVLFPTPGPTLPPTPESGEFPAGVLYQTSFDDAADAENWEAFDDGTISAKIEDSRLMVGIKATTYTNAQSGLKFTFEDFVLDVDAAKIEGPDDNGIIVVFNLTDRANYNTFTISSDGFYALYRVRGGAQTIVSDLNLSPSILTGDATNHIRLTGQNHNYRFEVNGTLLQLCLSPIPDDPSIQPLWDPSAPSGCNGGVVSDTWHSEDIPKGKIGLGALGIVTPDEPLVIVTIAFDNVVISSPDAAP